MSDQFPAFAAAVRARLDEMAKGRLFIVNVPGDSLWGDALWAHYLASFPAGTNPVYRERTEHDCSCCKGFIRAVGGVVAIENGAVTSIWDLNGLPEPYQTVADSLARYVKANPVCDVFLTSESKYGTDSNVEMKDGVTRRWNHFSFEVPRQFVRRDFAEKRGEMRTTAQVLLRGLTELKPDAVATVADLIDNKALYRGEEHAKAVREFQTLQRRVLSLPETERALIAWTMVDSPAARFRNTVIGTLVQDLSDGVDLERAVRSFETKVAPANYKRPTALITKGMVDAAMKTIHELGLEPALERRHARLSDVSVNNVLFVDNAVRGVMKGGVKDLLMQEVKPTAFDPKKAAEISIDAFIADVLPKATGLRLYVDNSALGNFASLTAPVHEDSKRLFKWSNDFAWSYDGNVADSIKDRVKAAGGQVEGVALRVSLAWSNYDDLDLHAFIPPHRSALDHIFFGNKMGILDVDMNAGRGETRQPVENMRWVRPPRDGDYRIFVHNYARRESVDVGFTVEIEHAGGVETMSYGKGVGPGEQIPVATLAVAHGSIAVTPSKDVVHGARSVEKWGLKTLDFARVNSLLLSPNHWDGEGVGNKHFFFILDGCRNPDPCRGIYNEFLSSSFERHRKVFEVLGDKTKCPVADEQLSGLGFSSTRKDRVTVIATGPSLNKAYTVVF